MVNINFAGLILLNFWCGTNILSVLADDGTQLSFEMSSDTLGSGSYKEGWINRPGTQLQYKAFSTPTQCEDAELQCMTEFGHLITLTNQTDETFIREFLTDNGWDWTILGLYKPSGSKNWTWRDGSLATHNIPTVRLFEQFCNCAVLYTKIEKAKNIRCSLEERPFICQRYADLCRNDPCRESGICSSKPNDFDCDCPRGLKGKICDEIINHCESSPCDSNGSCQAEPGGFHCICLGGYSGKLCETEIDECESQPCLNNGTCDDVVDSYKCSCDDGYTGSECQSEIDECQSQPCLNNGRCDDLLNSYRCVCAEGFTGFECQTDMDECQSRPCLNNAACDDLVNSYRCVCAAGFTGSECQTAIDECKSGPCMNFATCVDLDNGYACDCAPFFNGNHCQFSLKTTTEKDTAISPTREVITEEGSRPTLLQVPADEVSAASMVMGSSVDTLAALVVLWFVCLN